LQPTASPTLPAGVQAAGCSLCKEQAGRAKAATRKNNWRHIIMPRQKKNPPNDREALYDKLIATNPKIERKGDANPYTSLNGNMFTLLHQSRLAIRLPEDEREKFLKKYKTTLFEAYGAVMKEYVAVPDSLLENTKELQKYLDLSYEYAKTLKTKPTRKKH
jgi:TfoX/Sxy family transcriptional regulator of competence genes